jgi:hypothetical protein
MDSTLSKLVDLHKVMVVRRLHADSNRKVAAPEP